MFKIIPISSEIVKSSAPSFYHKDGIFYALSLNTKNVGLLGIKKLTKENAELELLIFKESRHQVLSKEKLSQLLAFPFNQGFKRVIIGTELKSLERLCRSFEMDFIFKHKKKSWFVKEDM